MYVKEVWGAGWRYMCCPGGVQHAVPTWTLFRRILFWQTIPTKQIN